MTADEIMEMNKFTYKYSVVDGDDCGFIRFAFSYNTDKIFNIFSMILAISNIIEISGFVLDSIYVYKAWHRSKARHYYRCMNYTDLFVDLLTGKR